MTMELGPVQKLWLRSMNEHPERQGKGVLAIKLSADATNYNACCLGELHICALKSEGVEPSFREDHGYLYLKGNVIMQDGGSSVYLVDSWQKYGLYSDCGEFKDYKKHKIGEGIYSSLAEANDSGATWAEIATFIEANPEEVFRHPF